jgi:hypothetical protein
VYVYIIPFPGIRLQSAWYMYNNIHLTYLIASVAYYLRIIVYKYMVIVLFSFHRLLRVVQHVPISMHPWAQFFYNILLELPLL